MSKGCGPCEACGETYDSAEYWEMRGREGRQVEIEEIELALFTLASNLAVAAGLERAFFLGYVDGWHERDGSNRRNGWGPDWRPNAEGKEAP